MSVELIHVLRGNKIESIHRGDIVIVQKSKIIKSYGDPYKRTFWRSAAKPFQVLPVLHTDYYKLTEKELALLTSSHGGEKEHVNLVNDLLNRNEFSVEDLDCGISRPMNNKASDEILKSNTQFTQANNPCSGKHTGMLLLLKYHNWPIKDYILTDHPVQKKMLETITAICELPENEIDIAIDGCGVPVFGMPLFNMALAYSKLDDNTNQYYKRIKEAMINNPFFVAGTKRLDTIIMEESNKKILAKLGAESVYCMTIIDKGIGIAVKIEDGSYRGLDALIPDLLYNENYITLEEYENIKNRLHLDVLNHRKQIVGVVKSTILGGLNENSSYGWY